ncbi:MAG: CHASE domain-containing protein [Verrucomicrobia bacterium]|nr:CHASE domain-containing protein [Verrucomicrobiota bacterium]
MPPAGSFRSPARLPIVVLVALCGLALTAWMWREARTRETQSLEAEFERQVNARHALVRETLGGYEDCLLALKLLLTYGETVDREEFAAAAQQQLSRHPGFLGVQWAPAVSALQRAGWENAHKTDVPAGIRERTRSGGDVPVGERDLYYPILFAEPLQANRHVIGSDAAASPIRADIARARTTGACVVSGLLKLVYESGPNDGIIMICPVTAAPSGPGRRSDGDGVLLGVFRVADLLMQPWNRAPGRWLDVMFIDDSSTRADRRILYTYVVNGGPAPTEQEFRRGQLRELPLQISGRNWRILYRPVSAPGSSETAVHPYVILVAGVLITTLGTGFLASRLRRTELIQREVRERTAELSESRRRLSSLMHALPGMAFQCRYEGQALTVLYASEGATALTGWTPDEFVSGQAQFREVVHPDDLARVREHTVAALRSRTDFEQEFRIRTRDAREKWVLSRGRGAGDSARGPGVFEGLVIDITAQKHAERERLNLERRLLEGQKLESLGLLAGGIAHDFNNLLATVIGNSNLLRLDPAQSEAAGQKLDAIETAAQRASDLCRQMLAYAGKGRFIVEPTDLSSLVETLVPLLDVSVAKQAHLRLTLARGLPPVRADATQLRQIAMNLVLNAADAIGDRGGEIAISTGVMRVDPQMLRACQVGSDLPPGDFAFLEVRDNGCGMPPEVLARIFDPFYTTKFAGRGLGLAAVLGIVRGHGGALFVQSAVDHGALFRLLLPAAGGATVAKAPVAAPPSDWKFTGRALVIDDDEPVRIVAAGMLKSIGASVQTVVDGQSGIEAFRANSAGFDVVLLDLLMPGLSGEETLKVLRSIRPDTRVLIISGFSEADVMQRLADDTGPFLFLHKPFTRAALIAALRQLLGTTAQE